MILLLAVPILIQVYFNSGLAYLLNRLTGESYTVACPSALIGASNFFELAVATRNQCVRTRFRRRAAVEGQEVFVEAGKQSFGVDDRRLGTIEEFQQLLEVSQNVDIKQGS